MPELFRPTKAIADGNNPMKKIGGEKIYFYSNTSASQIYVPYTNDIALGLKAGLHF